MSREEISNLELQNANHEVELGKLRDSIADIKLENDELKAALHESHQSLAKA